MNIFQKMKGSVMKAAASAQQMVASVSADISATANSAITLAVDTIQTQSVNNPNSIIVAKPPQSNPQDEFVKLFQEICQIVDALADSNDSDSAESDRKLYESKVRPSIRTMIGILQKESDRWLARYAETPDPEIGDLPCLEAFLRLHMMQELCIRAMRDMPRGCLPLIMGSTAMLLRYVKYPLLPHVTVYKPITNLISVACRYEAMHMGTHSQISKTDLASYKKRIDIDLTNLISTLWRKIADNPPLLEYFTLFDRRPSVVEGVKISLHAQMDVLTALISLMTKPRVGIYAKRALLLAVAMHDRRIDSFIVLNTDLVEVAIAELCKKFQSALEAVSADRELLMQINSNSYYGLSSSSGLTPTASASNSASSAGTGNSSSSGSNNSATAATGASSSLLRAAQANSQLSGNQQQQQQQPGSGSTHNNHNMVLSGGGHHVDSLAMVAVDAFASSLRFCDILVSTCTSLQALLEEAQAEAEAEAYSWESDNDEDDHTNNSHSNSNLSETEDDDRNAFRTPSKTRSTNPYSARRRHLHRTGSSGDGGLAAAAARSSAAAATRFAQATPLKLQFLIEFYNFFLHSNLRVALQSKEENISLATNVLLRRILCELNRPMASNKELLKLTTAYLSFHSIAATTTPSSTMTAAAPMGTNTLSKVLITRALSMNKPLSASSVQVIHDLLNSAPLQHAIVFLAKYTAPSPTAASVTDSSKPTSSGSNVGLGAGHLLLFVANDSARKSSVSSSQSGPAGPSQVHVQGQGQGQGQGQQSIAQADYLTLSNAVASKHVPNSSLAASHRNVDSRLAYICAVLATIAGRGDDDPTVEKGKGLGLDQQHAKFVAEAVLAKVADRFVSLDSQRDKTNQMPSGYVMDTINLDCLNTFSGLQSVRNSDFLSLLARKLSQYLTLRAEDQLIINALVSVTVRVLCSAVVLYSDSRTAAGPNLIQSSNGLHAAIGSYYLTNSLNSHVTAPAGGVGGRSVPAYHASSHVGSNYSAGNAMSNASSHSNNSSALDNSSVHSYVNLNSNSLNTSSHSQQQHQLSALASMEQLLHTQLFVEEALHFRNPLTHVQLQQHHQQQQQLTLTQHSQNMLTSTSSSSGSTSQSLGAVMVPAFDPLDPLLDILVAVEKIWVDLRAHTAKINDFGVKFCGSRQIMRSLSASDGHSNNPSKKRLDPLRKLIEAETPQVRKVLDSAVMVRELLAEVRGSVFAAKTLRQSLLVLDQLSMQDDLTATEVSQQQLDDMDDGWGVETSPSASSGAGKSSSFLSSSPYARAPRTPAEMVEEEDLWERAEEQEARRRAQLADVGFGTGVDISEADFLNEVGELETGLDQLLRQQQ